MSDVERPPSLLQNCCFASHRWWYQYQLRCREFEWSFPGLVIYMSCVHGDLTVIQDMSHDFCRFANCYELLLKSTGRRIISAPQEQVDGAHPVSHARLLCQTKKAKLTWTMEGKLMQAAYVISKLGYLWWECGNNEIAVGIWDRTSHEFRLKESNHKSNQVG